MMDFTNRFGGATATQTATAFLPRRSDPTRGSATPQPTSSKPTRRNSTRLLKPPINDETTSFGSSFTTVRRAWRVHFTTSSRSSNPWRVVVGVASACLSSAAIAIWNQKD